MIDFGGQVGVKLGPRWRQNPPKGVPKRCKKTSSKMLQKRSRKSAQVSAGLCGPDGGDSLINNQNPGCQDQEIPQSTPLVPGGTVADIYIYIYIYRIFRICWSVFSLYFGPFFYISGPPDISRSTGFEKCCRFVQAKMNFDPRTLIL